MRLSRVISSSMSATAVWSASGRDVAAAQAAQRGLDDHQRVADLVRDDGGEPAERRQPLALRRFALEAADRVGHRVEGGREQPRVLVFPPRAGRRQQIRRVRSPVAAISRIVAVMVPKRPRDGAGDPVADERRREDGEDGRAKQIRGGQRSGSAADRSATAG